MVNHTSSQHRHPGSVFRLHDRKGSGVARPWFRQCVLGLAVVWGSVLDLKSASITALGDLPGFNYDSIAYAISSDGSTVVGFGSGANLREAFRWTSGGGMVGLGDLPGGAFDSIAYGVSADGSTITGFGGGLNGREAFRWTSTGGMVGLGDLPGGGNESWAWGVSADGSTAVGYGTSANGREAFRWTSAGGMVGLGDLPGGTFDSWAYAASGTGNTIVGYGNGASGYDAFVWTPGTGMQSLVAILAAASVDLSDWSTLMEARGISADGRFVVGYGISQRGREAFVVDLAGTPVYSPIPEGSTYVAGVALGGLILGRWWRRHSPSPASVGTRR